MIAFVGVDGCGKSTILKILKQRLVDCAPVYIVCLRTNKPRSTLVNIQNHAQSPRQLWVSIAKICYKAVAWTLRYHFYFKPRIQRGSLVLLDRFYFDDLLIDPLKYRFNGPVGFLRKIRELVPRPEVYVWLDAPEEILYKRKQEVPVDEVARQRAELYNLMCGEARECYVLDAAAPVEQVSDQAFEIVRRQVKSRRADSVV